MTDYGDVPVTVALVAEDRHLGNRALVDAQAAWLAHGCRVEVVVPDAARLYDVPVRTPQWSVVVSRGRHLAGLGLLAAAAALGVPAVNDPRSIELVRNKIGMQAMLAHHDIPLPRTWFAGDPAVFGQLSLDFFPLVVKPYDGDGARGLALLTKPADVALLPPITGRRSLYLAQEYLHTDGSDLKLYGIGAKVWAVRKPSPVSFSGPGPAEFSGWPGDELKNHPLDVVVKPISPQCCQNATRWGNHEL